MQQHQPKSNINSLDSDSLRLILEQSCNFSLSELIPLRVVSSKWKLIIEKMFAVQKTLKLNTPYPEDRKFNDNFALAFPFGDDNSNVLLNQNDVLRFTAHAPYQEVGEFLLDLFPNIEKIFVYYKKKPNFDISILLENMSKLKSVSLFHGPHDSGTLRSMFNSISRSDSISSLYLISVPNLIQLEFNEWKGVLGNLEQFTLNICRKWQDPEPELDLVPILQNLEPKCRVLNLHGICLSGEIVRKVAELNPNLVQSLTNLSISSFTNDEIQSYHSSIEVIGKVVRAIGQGFGSLNYLDIEGFGNNTPLNLLLPDLTSLTNLTELHFSAYELEPEHRDHFLTRLTFPNIRILHFYYSSYSTGCHTYGWLARIFPNVVELVVTCNLEEIVEEWEGSLSKFEHLKRSLVCVWNKKMESRFRIHE